jgi:hypothetical protein
MWYRAGKGKIPDTGGLRMKAKPFEMVTVTIGEITDKKVLRMKVKCFELVPGTILKNGNFLLTPPKSCTKMKYPVWKRRFAAACLRVKYI